MRKRDTSRGFGFIETLIVVAVLVIITTIATGAYLRYGERQALRTAVRTVERALDEARSRTLASDNDSQYGAYFVIGSTTVTVYKGSSYSASDPNNEIIDFKPNVFIQGIEKTMGGPPNTLGVTFARGTGVVNGFATVTFALARDESKTGEVVIYNTGLSVRE